MSSFNRSAQALKENDLLFIWFGQAMSRGTRGRDGLVLSWLVGWTKSGWRDVSASCRLERSLASGQGCTSALAERYARRHTATGANARDKTQ
jgi:hypothetical protein